MFFAGLVALGFAAGSTAHMFISSPIPIEGSNPKNPLEPSGSDFPCHLGGTLKEMPTSGGQKMEAGSNQTLAFNLGEGANTAVHGGGSCQLSISYETDTAKLKDPKNWKVFYSIEGGCPTDAPGNLGQAIACKRDGTNCVNSFPFTLPKGVKDGHAILQWTWFNTIGNREMYSNCMHTQISGGDGSEMDDLPELFVANLASVGSDKCATAEQTNVKFPNPGKYVVQHTEGSPYPLADPVCAAGGGGSGTSQAPAAPSSYSAPQPSAYSAPASEPTSSPQAPSSTPPSAPSSPPPASSPSAPPAPTTNPSSCNTGEAACTEPGKLICIDTTHFGLCDIDFCAVPQEVAAGTQCKDGAITRKRKRGTLGLQKNGHRHFHHGPNHGVGNAV